MFKTLQKNNLKDLIFNQNLISGLLVSFIALPLCIAISIASGFPAISGIFTAIIGGIIVSQLSGSNVTINGPAAGMIVVILDAVEKLGKGDAIIGYKYTLAAIVFASILQIITSFTSLPEKMRKFPENTIRGMMIAIGLIVILKQIFILFGFKAPKVNLLSLFSYIPQAFLGMEIENFAIGIFSIIFILFWKKYLEKYSLFKSIPVYLVAIILGSLIAVSLDISQHKHFLFSAISQSLQSNFISLPDRIFNAVALPNFDCVFSVEFFFATFSIYAIASVETILSAIAVDKIDPLKRKTNLKKDIRAVGIGNFICGLIGCLPMIAEIVRSSANVKYGASNKWSNFIHAICLLAMITIFSGLLKFIPLCVLAAMLIIIGFGMINPKLLVEEYRKSKKDFLIILIVVFFTIYVDLLVGVVLGFLVNLFLKKQLIKE
jgi:MFS superfamily sulfate permease-like transporter